MLNGFLGTEVVILSAKNGNCIKATETPMLSGCSSEAYGGIAYNEGLS